MAKAKTDPLSEALLASLVSPNVLDSNGEPANVVDVLDRLSYSANVAPEVAQVAAAIEKAGKSIGEGLHDLASAMRESGLSGMKEV